MLIFSNLALMFRNKCYVIYVHFWCLMLEVISFRLLELRNVLHTLSYPVFTTFAFLHFPPIHLNVH